MGLILFLIFGFVVGLLARALMPGKDSMGLLATTGLGVGGAFIGWVIGRAFGFYSRAKTMRSTGFLMSLIGALILLLIANAIRRRRHHPVA